MGSFFMRMEKSMSDKKLYSCITKATKSENGNPRHSINWLLSKRGVFSVYEDYVKCGDWQILFSQIKSAKLYKTKQMFIPVNVLELTTETETYQFGFNPWANPFKHLKIEYEVESVKMGMSAFSLILRIALLISLLLIFITEHIQK
jgi:hypothetical protein